MSDALSAFPSRPLRARPPFSITGVLWTILAILMVAAMLGYVVSWVAPDLATDWQVRDVAVPIQGSDLSDGSCDSKMFIHSCDATLTASTGDGQSITRRVRYVFGSFTLGNFTAQVVADPKRPQWLTTDLGLDHIWNRTVTMIVAVCLLIAAVLGGIYGIMQAVRARASWRRAELVPLPLNLLGRQRTSGGVVWTVRADNGTTAQWTMARRAKPFVLGPADRVLGLATRTGQSLMPLDDRLRWVELSSAERDVVLQAQRTRQAI